MFVTVVDTIKFVDHFYYCDYQALMIRVTIDKTLGVDMIIVMHACVTFLPLLVLLSCSINGTIREED